MRIALSLIAATAFAAPALAQAQQTPSSSPSQASPIPMNVPPPAAQTPATSTAGALAPGPGAETAPEMTPPTDPAAIEMMSTLQNVCIPAANGGDLIKLAKAAGYKPNNDSFVFKRQGYQFTILPPGSNPNQCHVDVVHPVDPEAPAKPIVVALHNWAVFANGWSLYRNDKNLEGNQELTTRSWEHDDGPKHEALVIITYRKADGSPLQRSSDTSSVIYSVTPNAG